MEGDSLIFAELTNGGQEIILQAKNGLAVRFHEQEIRPTGRNTQGVKGVKLGDSDYVVGMVAVKRSDSTLFVVCENGYGKRSQIDEYRLIHRGGKGVISIKASERNGKVICIMEVVDDDELIVVTQKGIIIRLPIQEVRTIGRITQGVRIINLSKDDRVVDVERVPNGENDDIDTLEFSEEENGDGE